MNSSKSAVASEKARSLTGRGVLLWLVAFFAVVFGVNGIMIRAATSTFGGLESGNSYNAGLAYRADITAADAQNALNWQVDGHVTRTASGAVLLNVAVLDADRKFIPSLTVSARLAHPADSRLDQNFEMTGFRGGVATGTTQANVGQWDLILDFSRDGERAYRSRSRVTLR